MERAYGTRIVEGRAIEPQAYAAVLRGALAEAASDVKGALAEYGAALRMDPDSPEIWARVGALRCTRDPRDPRADEAIDRALSIDPEYPGGCLARARCAHARGDDDEAARAVEQASARDPLLAADLLPAGGANRDRPDGVSLLAAAVAAREPAAAWRAVAGWAERHADVDLRARALIAFVRSAPRLRAGVECDVEAMAGEGALREARAVAAAIVDAWAQPLAEGAPSLTARLAVDEAIDRDDEQGARRRAVRARVPLVQASARALLAGRVGLARVIASEVASASPSDPTARAVLWAVARRPPRALAGPLAGDDPRRAASDGPVAAEAWVALGVALASGDHIAEARATLGAVAHEPLPSGDERVLRPAVDLAWRGAIEPSLLPRDGETELRALGAWPAIHAEDLPGDAASLGLDARHRYLALVLTQPGDARALQLGDRLARVAPGDRVVAVARELAFLGQGVAVTASRADRLLATDPSDPLVAVTALRLAERSGDPDVSRRARAAVAALGRRALTE